MSYFFIANSSVFSRSLIVGQRSRSVSLFPRPVDIGSLNPPRAVSVSRSRRFGRLFKRIIFDEIQSYEMRELTSVEFQCKGDCPLGLEDASVEIPHSEISLQELTQMHFSHSRACYSIYQRVINMLPRQFNGFLAKRIFSQKYARLVNENYSDCSNECNRTLFMSTLEVEFFRTRAVQNSALLSRSVAIDVIFDAFVAASRLAYANSIISYFSFDAEKSEIFSDYLSNNLGASSCSFNVEALPGVFQPIVTELYLAGSVSANSIMWFSNHSELEVSDGTLDVLDSMLERWKSSYMEFLRGDVVFQTNLPGSMPEEEIPNGEQVGNMPSLIAGVSSVFSRVGKSVLNVENVISNANDITSSLSELTENMNGDYSSIRSSIDTIMASLTPSEGLSEFIRVFATRVAPLVLLIIGLLRYRSFIISCLKYVAIAALTYYGGAAAMSFVSAFHRLYAREVGMRVAADFGVAMKSRPTDVSGLTPEQTDKFWEEDETFVPSEVEFQSGFDVKDFIDLARPILNIRKFDTEDPLDSLVDIFTETSPWASDANKVLFITSKLSELWQKLVKVLGWYKPDFEKFCTGYADVDEFCKETMMFISSEDLVPTRAVLSSLERLYNLSAHLRTKYEKNQAVNKILSDFIPKLHKLLIEFRKLNFDSKSYRVEPVNLMLTSKPGLGKTTALEIINDRLCSYVLRNNKEALELFKSRPKEFLYARNTSKYWEGVSNHTRIVYYADYMAGKAEVTGCSHEAELMDLIGCQQFCPDMAFDKKGMVDIRPDFVTMGTNETSITGEGARHKGAVARRLNPYELVWVGPGNGPRPGMALDPAHWRFRPKQFSKTFALMDASGKKDLTLDELVALTIIRREVLVRKMANLRNTLKVDSTKSDLHIASTLPNLEFKEGQDEYDILETMFQTDDVVLNKFTRSKHYTGGKLELVGALRLMKSLPDSSYVMHNFYEDDFKAMILQCFIYYGAEQNVPESVAVDMYYSYLGIEDYESIFLTAAGRKEIPKQTPWLMNLRGSLSFLVLPVTQLVKNFVVDNSIVIASTVISLIGYFALTADLGSKDEQMVNDEVLPGEQSKTYVDHASLLKAKNKKDKRKQKLRLQRIVQQAGMQVPVAVEKAKYHTFSLRSSGVHFQDIIALEDRVFFINAHCIRKLKAAADEIGEIGADFSFEAVNLHRQIRFEVLYSEIMSGFQDEHSDLAFFVAKAAPQSRSILPHWVEDHFIVDKMDVESSTGVGAYLSSHAGPQYAQRAVLINGKNVGRRDDQVFIRQLWSTVMISESGDCGGLYFTTSNIGGQAGKFIGFHAMGYPGHGPALACAVTKSTIENAINTLLERPVKVDEAGRDVIGEGERQHFNQTKIREVLVPLPRPYEPKLTNVQCNDPEVYKKSVAKYNKTKKLTPILRSRLKESVENYVAFCERSQTIPMRKGLLDLEQAIVGLPGTSFESIDLSTSPGYPHNCSGPQSKPLTKHALVGKFENGVFVPGSHSSVTIREVTKSIEMLSRGEVPLWVFTDVVKSETLPKEKVAQGKGRLVSAAPNSAVLVTRMLFGNFMMWMKDNYLSNGVSYENPEGVDAHMLTEKHLTMAAMQDLHTAGDLSAYDTRHSADALEVALEVITDFILRHNPEFDELEKTVFRTYIKSMSYTYHIRGKTMHRWVGSLASGHPLTTIINSVLNHGYFGYSVWKKAGFRPRFWDWYFKNVMVRVLGDDNRCSCSPEASELVSEQVCADGYADFGHVYTDDLKSGELHSQFRPFGATSILKRFCRYEPALGMYVWPLRIDVVEEMPLWTKSEGQDNVPSMEQALSNVDTAVRHLSYHSDEEWNRLIPQWEKMYAELGWKCSYVSRVQCLKSIFGDEFSL